MHNNIIYRYIPGDGPQSFKSDHIIKNQGTTGYTKGNIHKYPKVDASNPSPNYQYPSSTAPSISIANEGLVNQNLKQTHEQRIISSYGPPPEYHPTNQNKYLPLTSQNLQQTAPLAPPIQATYHEPIYQEANPEQVYGSNKNNPPSIYSPPETIQNIYDAPDIEGSGSDIDYESNRNTLSSAYSTPSSNYATPQKQVSSYPFDSSTIPPPVPTSEAFPGISISPNYRNPEERKPYPNYPR